MVGCAHGAQAELDGAIDIVLDVSEAVEHRGVGMYVQGCETAVGGGAGHAPSSGRRGRLRCGAPLGASMQAWLRARLYKCGCVRREGLSAVILSQGGVFAAIAGKSGVSGGCEYSYGGVLL